MAKKTERTFPELDAMSDEQVMRLSEWYESDEAHEKYMRLVEARDEAQRRVSEHMDRKFHITKRITQILLKQRGGD